MRRVIRTKPCIPSSDTTWIKVAWDDILTTGNFIQGKYVKLLEERFAAYCGTKYAIATSSGASALEVAIRAITSDDDQLIFQSGRFRAMPLKGAHIIVQSNTFPASINSIIRAGCRPIISDIDPYTMSISYKIFIDIMKVDSRINAIMLVHMAGLINPDYDKIKNYCDEHGIMIIEDASHAVGSKIHNIFTGNLGEVGCFSLFATKIITSGEGGIITTNDDNIYKRALILRNHGCVRNVGELEGVDYGVTCTDATSNFRMPELSAVIGASQVPHIDEFVNHRNLIADIYMSHFKGSKFKGRIITPFERKDIRQSWWQYIVQLPYNTRSNRDEICNKLFTEFGIETANAYSPPCHEQPAYKEFGYDQIDPVEFSGCEVLKNHIALPMHSTMSIDDALYVINSLDKLI
jgi:perosamine synthetase